MQPSKRQFKRTKIILAAIPIIPILLVLIFNYIPADSKQYMVKLTGQWQVKEGHNPQWKAPDLNTKDWRKIYLPGSFPKQKVSTNRLWLRKTFQLKAKMKQENLFFMLSASTPGVGRVFINGHYVGNIGHFKNGKRLKGISDMNGIFVGKQFCRAKGDNVIAIRWQWLCDLFNEVREPMIYIGVDRVMKPYFQRNKLLLEFFQYGVIFYSFFIILLMIALSLSNREAKDNYKYQSIALLAFGIFFYNLTFSSAFLSHIGVGAFLKMKLLAASIIFLSVPIIEFFEYYFLARITRFGKINRFIGGPLSLAVLFIPKGTIIQAIYENFVLYFFCVILYLVFISLREVFFRKRKEYGVIMAFALIGGAISGISDLLVDLFILEFQHVFSITISDAMIAASIVVILDFIEISRTNKILADDLQDMNQNLEQKVEERTKEVKEARDALWGEMQLAKKIQTVLLPEQPAIAGCSITACMIPADEVGGDYYDVINTGDTDWLVIGDVSGHGVPAGLVMMMVQTAIRVSLDANPELPPSELLALINKTISRNIKQLGEDKYMTISVMAAHQEGKFTFSGLHQDIMIHRAATGKVEFVETKGMWIGILEEIGGMLQNDSLQLAAGDTMLVYTDGVTEATKNEEMYGEERLASALQQHQAAGPEQVKQAILDELGNWKRPDDVTMVILQAAK